MNEPIAELIAWYLDLNEREKQLSPHTIKAYHTIPLFDPQHGLLELPLPGVSSFI